MALDFESLAVPRLIATMRVLLFHNSWIKMNWKELLSDECSVFKLLDEASKVPFPVNCPAIFGVQW